MFSRRFENGTLSRFFCFERMASAPRCASRPGVGMAMILLLSLSLTAHSLESLEEERRCVRGPVAGGVSHSLWANASELADASLRHPFVLGVCSSMYMGVFYFFSKYSSRSERDEILV